MGAAAPDGPLDLVGQRVVAHIHRRLALLAVELTEEEIRFARLLGWQLLALFLTCLTVTLVALLVVGAWWDTAHRMNAIAWACGGAGLASAGLWTIYKRQLSLKPVAFAQTLVELERDARALDPRVTELTQP